MSFGLCSVHGLASPVSSAHCLHPSKWQAVTRETDVPNCSVVPICVDTSEVHFCLVIYLFFDMFLVNYHFSQSTVKKVFHRHFSVLASALA